MIRYFWPSDDEQLAGQWQDSHFDEDGGWWANVQQSGATFALATALTLASLSTALASSVFSQSQDDPAGSLLSQPLVQEEYWQNQVAPVNWPQPSVLVDDDVHPTFVQVFTPDDGDWKPLVAPVPATNYVRLPFLDPEEIPVGSFPAAINPIDDAALVWSPQIPPWELNWTLLFFLDDGSTVPVFQYDEDFWPAQAQPVPYNWPQSQQPFNTGDDDQLIPQFPAEDVIWLQLVPPVPLTHVWPQPFQFEQNDQAANLVAFTDEIFWPSSAQPAPVPDSIWLLRQDAFEQHDANGVLTLTLDDGVQPGWTPHVPFPDPGGFGLLQQWPFEQNEPAGSLYALRDEDFWTPQIPPVNWPQPSLPILDEVIVGQPTATLDELYWGQFTGPWVAPVVDSLRISFPYLPEPEEIPAGSLVPPQPPPPPPFCPLPPLGPDGDTSISVFGGRNQPTLALFCRICNSGKPLVVRADYAIWCQDCCAFVSKQDTYMGTTRAPGPFKGVF